MEINRKAIIIACPGNRGEKGYLPGTLKDLENYSIFLKSNLGGAWLQKEIVELRNPNYKDIKNEIDKINSGYSIVYFTGHGFINKIDSKQYIQIKDGDIWVGTLLTKANWQAMILDCCRGLHHSKEIISESFQNFSGGGILKAGKTDFEARTFYNKELNKCEHGVISLFAASPLQAAGEESELGGYFSHSLIEASKEWERTNKTESILDFFDAKEKAFNYMKRNFVTTQVPQINTGKRNFYFPFAIKKIKTPNQGLINKW